MGATAQLALPYPEQADPVDVAGDVKKLAEAVEAKLEALRASALLKTGGTITGNLVVTGSVTSQDFTNGTGFSLRGGGQLEVYRPGTSTLTTVAVANAAYANQAAAFGQVSTREAKEGIHDMPDSSGILDALRPVTFRYKPGSGVPEHQVGVVYRGLIAEEVAEAGAAILTDPSGKPITIRDHDIIAMLVAEVQSLRKRVAALEA